MKSWSLEEGDYMIDFFVHKQKTKRYSEEREQKLCDEIEKSDEISEVAKEKGTC